MIDWKSVHLEDVGPYKKQTFVIPEGITTVYGDNRSSNSANGAGKSMLFNSIFDTVLEEVFGAEKSDRIRTGVRGVKFALGDHQVSLRRAGSKPTLTIDGKSVTGTTNVRRALAERLPITADDVAMYMYVDNVAAHPLVRGSNAQRKDALTKFFGLDKIDAEKKIIKAELERLQSAKIRHASLKERLAEIDKQLPEKKRADFWKRRHEELQEELDALQQVSEDAEATRRAALFADQAKTELDHYLNGASESGNSDLDHQITFFKEEVDRYTKLCDDGIAWKEYNEQSSAYNAYINNLSDEAQDFLEKGGTRARAVEGLSRYELATRKLNAMAKELASVKAKASMAVPSVEEPSISRGEARSKLDSLVHKLEHAKKFGKGACPTCGQFVKVSDPEQINAAIKATRKVLAQWDDYLDAQEALKERGKARATYTRLNGEAKELQAQQAKYKKYSTIADELLEQVDKPEPFKGKKVDYAMTKKVLEEVEVRLKALQFLDRNRPMLKLVVEQGLLKDDEVEIPEESGIERVAAVSKELTQMEARLGKLKILLGQRRKIIDELASLQKSVARESDIRELLSGYDDKAMKRLAVKAISSKLGEQINKYAKVVFREDFTFELIWDTSQVQLLAHRHYADRTDTTDVRRLSGAESKLFTLALVAALQTFVPKQRRSSMLVLDEPTASFGDPASSKGEASMQSIRDILPILKGMFKSVIIITPKSTERFGGKEFTVCKSGGYSTIKPGHPLQLKEAA